MSGALRHWATRVRWFWREASGEAAYERYVAHTRTRRPGEAVLSRREFERRRVDEREVDPRKGFHCC
ncbi:YbdD/YjiX family protein [Streptomyces sp. NPDC005438]|uniref:YbdD/YjiX family protein n=1 Tax=Streptomyces sp. NPDC005438 TaxID=3156880 RepID=UPI0033BDE093